VDDLHNEFEASAESDTEHDDLAFGAIRTKRKVTASKTTATPSTTLDEIKERKELLELNEYVKGLLDLLNEPCLFNDGELKPSTTQNLQH
jgi:hypothetical protein